MKFLLALISGFLILPTFALAQNTFEVSGWIPYWKSEEGVEDVIPHLDQITTVHPFGFTVGANGSLFDAAELTKEPWPAFIEKAKEAKVRVIPTILWNDAEAMHRVLSNDESRKKFVEEIVKVVYERNYDGIDLDFEGKRAATKNYFSAFLRELYGKMGKKWVYCTIEARTPLDSRFKNPPDPKLIQYANDFEEINKYCDRVQVMTYDQGGSDSKLTAARKAPYIPLSDPAWVEKVMTLTAQTISKDKLVLGVPTYGYEYEIAPLVNYGRHYNVLRGFNPAYALRIAAQYGITPVRNSAGELSLLYKPTGTSNLEDTGALPEARNVTPLRSSIYSQAAIAGELVPPYHILWWSDAQAIADKVEIAKRLNLKGVAVFKFDGGEDQGIWSILR